MKYRLKAYSIWEYGSRKDAQGNPHQEDCTFPLPGELNDSDRTFILCDGMGGHDAGEVASATVCQAMGEYILHDGHDDKGAFTADDLSGAIDAAFTALDAKDNGAEKKMGTTMTLLKLHNEGATVAHIGDSRVYHIRPGKDGASTQILFETEDHSLVNDLVKIGELTKEEARTSRQKNVITRAMQPRMDRRPHADVKTITDIKAGDFFYMCSDGMLEQEEMASGESIRNIFSNAVESVDDKVKILTEVTKDNRDNHTALIIHILDVEDDAEKTAGKTVGDDAEDKPQPVAPVKKDEKHCKPSADDGAKKKSGRKLLRCAITAIVVAAGIVGFKYFPSCSSDDTDSEHIEATPQDTPAGDSKPETPARPEGKPQPQKEQPVQQPQQQHTNTALEAANSQAAQTATGDNRQQQPETQQPESPAANLPQIQLPQNQGVVASDEQQVLDKLNNKQ